MTNARFGTTWTKLTAGGCTCSVLMFLESCDPAVRDVWEAGITTSAVGIVTALTSLLTTAVTALIKGAAQNGGDGETTVQAVFDWASHVLC